MSQASQTVPVKESDLTESEQRIYEYLQLEEVGLNKVLRELDC